MENSSRYKQSPMKRQIRSIRLLKNWSMQKGIISLTANKKKIDIEKENNVKLNKKFEDQKNESEKQIVTHKIINLGLENKVNKYKNMNIELTTCK